MGTFEFRICSIDADPNQDATQACLDLNLLTVENGTTRYPVSKSYRTAIIKVVLPSNLVCKHCVFQWKYKTGNSWGSLNGRGCLGCGIANEEFYGCSDIAILSPNERTSIETAAAASNNIEAAIGTNNIESTTAINNIDASTASTESTTNAVTTSVSTVAPKKCTSAITFSQSFDIGGIMNQYCQIVCPNCPLDIVEDNDILYNGCTNSCKTLCTCV